MIGSWCDKLASTAGAGFLLDWDLAPGSSLLAGLKPVLAPLAIGEKTKFNVDNADATSAMVSTDEGFQYSLSSTQSAVTFVHRLQYIYKGSGLPVLDILSKAAPYTRQLDEISLRLASSTSTLPNIGRRKINRVGIVSHTVAAPDELPPGIQAFMTHLGNPWKKGLSEFNVRLVSKLTEDEVSSTRCVHHIIKNDDEHKVVTLRLDWQRLYVKGISSTHSNMIELLKRASDDALAYFEDLAEGTMFHG